MGLPAKLKNLNLFNEGRSMMGEVKSTTIPKFARKLESYRGAGMSGPVKVDLGQGDDGLQFEWTLGGFDLLSLRQMGVSTVDGVYLRFAAAYQRDDTGSVDQYEIVVRGRHEEIDPGDQEPGEDTEHKVTTACSYYKLTVNGVVEVEIDQLAGKEIFGGVDRNAEINKAIGLL